MYVFLDASLRYLILFQSCFLHFALAFGPRVKEPREEHNNTDSSSEQVKVPNKDDRRCLHVHLGTGLLTALSFLTVTRSSNSGSTVCALSR